MRGSLYDPDDLKWAQQQGVTIITIDRYYEIGLKKCIEINHGGFKLDGQYNILLGDWAVSIKLIAQPRLRSDYYVRSK